ncbi:MAG TPA: glycosyltransferase [Anaerolineae bacterium]|nr:glycosyltransferase [Anaerolineae bacterium]
MGSDDRIIDIVIGTHNRLEMLQRTIQCIQTRTFTPYRLTVIDDGSTDGTAEWVQSRGCRLHRRKTQGGMHQNLIDVVKVSSSDPVICTDDDGLCPVLNPDWLRRLLDAMAKRPKLMMLGLDNPGDNKSGSRHPLADDGEVIYSEYVGGLFLAMRRKLLDNTGNLFGDRKSRKSPNKAQARYVHKTGGQVGYLKHVYTYHYCPVSIRVPGKKWTHLMVEPVNMETLEPPEEYRQCPLR